VGRKGIRKKKSAKVPARWTIADTRSLYLIEKWGLGYFDVNRKGNLVVRPNQKPGQEIDLKELTDELVERGIDLPILIRFTDILKSRVDELNKAFGAAIKEYGYQGNYKGVFPIKVNQHRQVVEDLLRFGRKYDFGLEAGSKPELMLAVAMQDSDKGLVVCNGYKDKDYILTALHAARLGRKIILVVEKLSELNDILMEAENLGVEPQIGLRVKLSSDGKGKWEDSAGDRSKFGLTVSELLKAVNTLRNQGKLGFCRLLHFHLGSQITSIQKIKDAMSEGTKIFTELHRLGVPLQYIDVGGGLAVDYDGSKTDFSSSANYTLGEYASDVICTIAEACDEKGIPHPCVISESGRALVAHHSVLVFEVLGSAELGNTNLQNLDVHSNEFVDAMLEVERGLTRKNFQEFYHDALQIKDEALGAFNLGYLEIENRAAVESIFWKICRKIVKYITELDLDYVPDELEGLEILLSDTYYANFSVFQSAPDHWAVKQMFPVLPIHRLNQHPTRKAVIADITCDSDGKMDRFIDLRDVKDTLDLHPLEPGEPYYCGIFLIGAYQEILGDLHNLFGDTNTVHVSIPKKGVYEIEKVIPGDSVAEVLSYVQYNREDIMNAARKAAELGVARKLISLVESKKFLKFFEEGLSGYTYLEKE